LLVRVVAFLPRVNVELEAVVARWAEYGASQFLQRGRLRALLWIQTEGGGGVDSRIQGQWATLPGFRPHYGTFGDVNVLQSFENPYAVPYYLYRSRQDGGLWNYWAVGVRRSWKVCEKWLVLTKVYGANPNKWNCAYRRMHATR
jgi:hypothetical protein